jgi:DNA polymerase-1
MVRGGMWLMHNAPFDCLHLSKFTDEYSIDDIMQNVTDTQILAHLIDPREKVDGGIGHGLKELCAAYVDANSPDGQQALKNRFKELGFKNADGFKLIPLWDEIYVMYAGLDVILTARLAPQLIAKVKSSYAHLIDFEHEVQRITTAMTHRGFAVDLQYATMLNHDLGEEEVQAIGTAAKFGVANVNSTSQVAEALQVRGVQLTEKTPSGKWKVDKKVLESLQDDELAQSVLTAKGASKAMSSWVAPLIEHGQIDGRVHCRIKTLAARTSRMSIANPPLQQLPANDHRIRTCLIADQGQTLVACDFKQIEFRVLAYLAQEETMISAILNGEDLHDSTAARLFGDDFTSLHRKLAKGVGFGVVYGGGKDTLARQAGVSPMEAQKAIASFERNFPRVQRWKRSLIDKVTHGEPLVVLPTGREIPLDRKFGYRSVNYLIQGLAAELFKGSLIELNNAGLGEHLLVPIHDEVLFQVRETDREEFARTVVETMSGELGQVPIDASSEIIGSAWGNAYLKEAINA